MAHFSTKPSNFIGTVTLSVFRHDEGYLTGHGCISHDLRHYAGLSLSGLGEEFRTVVLEPYYNEKMPVPWNQLFFVTIAVTHPRIDTVPPSSGCIDASDLLYFLTGEDIGSWLHEIGPSAAHLPEGLWL